MARLVSWRASSRTAARLPLPFWLRCRMAVHALEQQSLPQSDQPAHPQSKRHSREERRAATAFKSMRLRRGACRLKSGQEADTLDQPARPPSKRHGRE